MLPFSDSEYLFTRFVFQRLLGCIYLIGFLVVVNQFLPLCGERGITPAALLIKRTDFWHAPSIFRFSSSDRVLLAAGWLGVVLSITALSGLSERYGLAVSFSVWFFLWALYLSYVNIGGTFYAFGWESLLLEAGFLGMFLGSSDTRVPVVVIWLLRWVLFRLMFGAGLIKLRGDSCWRDLTCMLYHYETQPLPNPLSWYFHYLPGIVHRAGVLFNHFVELIVPFGCLLGGMPGAAAGLITVLFQGMLIMSGNFSWLNWLTIVLCVPCFSDRFFAFLPLTFAGPIDESFIHEYAVLALTALILVLSAAPTLNMLSPHQIMNTSFDPLHLVNTYGAFGRITRTRREIIIEGTDDPSGVNGWQPYEFRAKPGDIRRTPPLVAPYHLRLDWMMWFAPLSPWQANPWFIRFLEKLAEGDRAVLGLLQHDPFAGRRPRLLRAVLYEYRFASPEEKRRSGAVWTRTKLRLYCPVIENTKE